MKASNYYYIIAIIAIVGLTAVLADNPTPIDPKEKELNDLLKKSVERLKVVNSLVKRIDNVANTEVTGMKDSIKTLEEVKTELIAEKEQLIVEKQQLVEEKEQLSVVLYETQAIIKRDTIPASPFKLEPIVPVSENWGGWYGCRNDKKARGWY